MERIRSRFLREERGSVLPLIAFAMTCLLGFVALGVDVGRLYVERARLQSVSDVAALSAAQYLAKEPLMADQVARDYLQKNGVDSSRANVAVDSLKRTVKVGTAKEVGLTVARFIGHQKLDVYGGSVAAVEALNGVFGAAPLGVAEADWKLYDQVILKMSANDGYLSPGNYQALALGKSGSSMYELNLTNGYQDWLRAGQWIETEPGNMATPTVRAARNRIAADPTVTYTTVEKGSPRLLMVPILKDFTVNGQGQVQIVGFGMFFLEKVEETGSDKSEITGRFLKMFAEGESDATTPDFGLVRTKLIQ